MPTFNPGLVDPEDKPNVRREALCDLSERTQQVSVIGIAQDGEIDILREPIVLEVSLLEGCAPLKARSSAREESGIPSSSQVMT